MLQLIPFWHQDPIAGVVAVGAGVVLAWSLLFRRGGVDARLVIDLFAYAATVASVARLVWTVWRSEPITISGTDSLLLLGALIAVFVVTVQGTKASLLGDDGRPSLVGQLLIDRKLAWMPDWVRTLLGLRGRTIAGQRLTEVVDHGESPHDREPG